MNLNSYKCLNVVHRVWILIVVEYVSVHKLLSSITLVTSNGINYVFVLDELLDNLVLATKENNMRRSNLPIKDFINPLQVKEYLKQFLGVLTDDFSGDKYIKKIVTTLKKIGVNL